MLNFDLPIPAALAVSALVPLAVGMIWYNPKLFGASWMDAVGLKPEDGSTPNMLLVFGLTFVFSFFMGFVLMSLTNHHYGFYSMLMGPELQNPSSNLHSWAADVVTQYGGRYRTFRHGALHGALSGVFFVTPIVAINAMFERRGWKYIAITGGYWTVCLAIMGAIICHFTPAHMM